MHDKHRGCRAELIAALWLLENGYEVFRNVSAHGYVDVIGLKEGVATLFDVKSGSCRRSSEQIALDVRILVVDGNGCRILDREPECGVCLQCGATLKGRQQRFCSEACGRAHGNLGKPRKDRALMDARRIEALGGNLSALRDAGLNVAQIAQKTGLKPTVVARRLQAYRRLISDPAI
jgi:hypothetical protein